MNYKDIYQEWLNNEDFDPDFRAELKALSDEKEIEDRFYKPLSFGTAGMRGVIGAGLNRINKYNIRKATQGFSEYLKSKNGKSVVIAHDNRNQSVEFCKEAASVFSANGLKTYIFESLRSTPELSFTVRHLQTAGGVVITASHNPPEYNGYKVYGSDGAQLIPENADIVSANVEAINDFSSIKFLDYDEALSQGLIEVLGEEIDNAYLSAVQEQIIHKEAYQIDYKIAYSPLHGTGGMIIKKLFNQLGIKDAVYEPQQMQPDTQFSTVKQPNPEEEQAFGLLKKLGEKENAEMLIATDPDADRVGIMVKNKGQYVKLNGNEVGTLLTNYVLSEKKLPENPFMVKTVVSSDLCLKIADDNGVGHLQTLTGFKFIGNEILKSEQKGDKNFVMGYEESYGYMVGTYVRDKDAVVTTMLIVEMAKYYHQQGKNLFDVLEQIQNKYGYHLDRLIAKTLKGKAGMEQISLILETFRSSAQELKDIEIVKVEDFSVSTITDLKSGKVSELPHRKSNILKYYLENGSWFALRPSGTEPKIKFYIAALGKSKAEAETLLGKMTTSIEDFIEQILAK